MELTEKYLQKKEQYNANAILAVLLLGGFISLFSETILNVAFPKLMLEMNISATTVEWLTTGYVLVVAILVPVTAFLINTFTTKQLFLSAMILFFIGSLRAALVILPSIVIGALLNPVSGKVYDKFGGKIIIPAGVFLLSYYLVLHHLFM